MNTAGLCGLASFILAESRFASLQAYSRSEGYISPVDTEDSTAVQVSSMTMQSPHDLQSRMELRIRTIRTLWIGMLLSVVLYYLLTFFVGRSKDSNPNNALSLMLIGVGLLTTLISVPLKKKLLARSVEHQRLELVQQGYIIAWALTEVAALLGLLDFFLTGNRYYYVLFLVAAIGQLLHFPRRQDVLAACYKKSTSIDFGSR